MSRKTLIRLQISVLACIVFGIAPAMEAFAFTRDGKAMLMPSGESRPLFLARGHDAALAPNGALAYVSADSRSGAETVYLVSTAHGAKRALHASKGRLRHLGWSRQGRLLFLESIGGKDGLRVLDVPGPRGAVQIATIPVPAAAKAVFSPRWHPDGNAVVFHDLDNVFLVDLDGRTLQKWSVKELTGRANSVDSLCSFVFCPGNPKLLAYTAAVKGTPKFEKAMGGEPNTALFTIDLQTKSRKRLSPPDMVCTDPAWSKNGKTIYLCGYREAHYFESYPFRIYSIKPDGTKLTEICKGENPQP